MNSLVFVFAVHMMLKLLGPRQLGKQHLKRRHYEDQAKSKKKRKCCLRTVWWHTGLSGAPGTIALMASSRWHYGEKTTRLSGVKSRVSGLKSLRERSPTVLDQRLSALDSEQCTIRCTTGLFGVP
jgi:hypothetical protein